MRVLSNLISLLRHKDELIMYSLDVARDSGDGVLTLILHDLDTVN